MGPQQAFRDCHSECNEESRHPFSSRYPFGRQIPSGGEYLGNTYVPAVVQPRFLAQLGMTRTGGSPG